MLALEILGIGLIVLCTLPGWRLVWAILLMIFDPEGLDKMIAKRREEQARYAEIGQKLIDAEKKAKRDFEKRIGG